MVERWRATPVVDCMEYCIIGKDRNKQREELHQLHQVTNCILYHCSMATPSGVCGNFLDCKYCKLYTLLLLTT